MNNSIWFSDYDDDDGFEHHYCSHCRKRAPYYDIYEPMYDEGMDGEDYYVCDMVIGISEFLTKYCPNCGNKMKNYECDESVEGGNK